MYVPNVGLREKDAVCPLRVLEGQRSGPSGPSCEHSSLRQMASTHPGAERDAGTQVQTGQLSAGRAVGWGVGWPPRVLGSTHVHPSQPRKIHRILLQSHLPAEREPIENYNKGDLVSLFNAL